MGALKSGPTPIRFRTPPPVGEFARMTVTMGPARPMSAVLLAAPMKSGGDQNPRGRAKITL